MALATDLSFSFVRGLRTDGGPFFTEQGFYQDAKNTVHHPTGEIENRRGIEILSGTGEDTITSKTDATNLFLASMAFAEIIKDEPATTSCLINRAFSYGTARMPTAEERTWLTGVQSELRTAGVKWRELMRRIALNLDFYTIPTGETQTAAVQQ